MGDQKPKSRAAESPLGEILDLGGKYTFPSILNARLNAEKKINQTLLDEFKIQEGVQMSSQLPYCDDSRRFGFAK